MIEPICIRNTGAAQYSHGVHVIFEQINKQLLLFIATATVRLSFKE